MTGYPELHAQTIFAARRIEMETSVFNDDNDNSYNTSFNYIYSEVKK